MTVLNAQEWIGRTVGSYRVLMELGRGRRGIVFLGEHVQNGSRAAVKVFPKGPVADAVTAIAPALTRIRHPHIVRLIEAGDADGAAFIAEELVQSSKDPSGQSSGRSLADHLHDTADPIGEQKTIDITLDLLAALEYAHAPHAGCEPLPHGGLHPANVMLDAIDDRLVARIAELGVPVVRERRIAADAYLSPEELQGTPASIASDIYAVGALCYLMLTAMAPQSPLVPPCLVRQNVSFMWDAFMRQSMAYDSSKRFADYAAMRAALTDIRAATGKRRIWRTMRVALFTNALVGVLVVTAVIVVLYYRSHRPPEAPVTPQSSPEAVAGSPSLPSDLPPAGTDGQQSGSMIVLDKSAQHRQPPHSPSVMPGSASDLPSTDATSILDTTSTVSIPGLSPSQDVGTASVIPPVVLAESNVTVVSATGQLAAIASVPPSQQPAPQPIATTSTPATVDYTVRPGDTAWNIAKAHGIPFATFLTMNSLTVKSMLKPGQKLIVTTGGTAASPSVVPAAFAAATQEIIRIIEPAPTAPPATPPPPATSTALTHVVARGENYYSIARKYGCDVRALQSLNNNVALKTGQTIKVPPPR